KPSLPDTSQIFSGKLRANSLARRKSPAIRRSLTAHCEHHNHREGTASLQCVTGYIAGMRRKIVLGTRGSALARAQAGLVEKALQTAGPGMRIETRIIATGGDKARLREDQAGRKGLFTVEIQRALLAGDVDVAVHSAKDLPSDINADAEIAAV